MSSEHKKPLFAFVVITIACCVFMGYTVRAQALGDLIRGDRTPGSLVAEMLRLGDEVAPTESRAAAGRLPDSTAPTTSEAPAVPSESPTAHPVARPGFGEKKVTEDEARVAQARRHSAEIKADAVRAMRDATAYRVDHDRSGAHRDSHSHDRGRTHGREHAPGQQRRIEAHRAHRPAHADRGHHRGHQRGHHKGHQRGHHKGHQRGHHRGHQRGHHGRR
ncbi:hypothetical protein ncot_05235 [Nocardioides sp. JQ2195]|uniref:hypothetical protein n=1 Tax=Nocardioides sp. JQ2195 TaxID=2592334 RepID=UPI00143E9195|nr:hypothetical protein [Nocardioides sp. JQ2195]QIX26070.1 hypothetical protein ncot_05235 [Nocardioides sp. JQ2195]